MRRQAFQQRQLRLVMVDPPAKAKETKHAESQRQREPVARVLGNVFFKQRHRPGAIPIDGQANRLDVPCLARRDPAGQGPRVTRRCLRLADARLDLTEPRFSDMRQRKLRIGGDRPVKQHIGPGIG